MLRPTLSHLSLAGLGAGLLLSSVPQSQTATEALGQALARDVGAWSDFDGDGNADLLAIHATGKAALLRNLGDGQFDSCSEQAGLQGLAALRGASWIDFDVDSDPDLFLVGLDGTVRFFRNDDASFVDATEELGLRTAAGVLRAHWTDFDSDGLDDLVLTLQDGYRFLQNAGTTFVERSALALDTPLAGGAAFAGAASGTTSLSGAGAGLAAGGAPAADAPDSLRGGAGRSDLSIGGIVRAPGGSLNGTATGYCAEGIVDQNGSGNCVEASRSPTLGKLYPMSLSLNVQASTGRVGVGTQFPSARLDIVETQANTPALEVNGTASTALVVNGTSSSPAARITSSSSTQAALFSESTGGDFGVFAAPRLGVGRQLLGLDVPRVEMGLDAALAGEIEVEAANGVKTVWIQGQEASNNGAQLALYNYAGTLTAEIDAEAGTRGGEFKLFSQAGTETVEISAEEVAGNGAQIILRKADGTASIILDAEQSGDGRITTQELQITGGADLVEHFDTSCGTMEPGTVLVIDADNPGRLCASNGSYDRKVAGVISGAGGVKPGIFLGQDGMIEGDTPVALTGRVYVRCSAENGPVEAGDLLTTASLAGHAMRVDEFDRATGAVIGKAMTTLEEGTGLVLVLVNLQ